MIEVRPYRPRFAAQVFGLPPGTRLGPAAANALRQAWLDYGVVIVRGLHYGDDDLVAVSRVFGEPELAPASERQARGGGLRPDVWVVSNVIENGRPIGSLGYGEAEWHSDMSYLAEPPTASLLYALEVSPEGGDTWFADMAAAHDALAPDLKAAIAGERINHPSSLTATGDLRLGATRPADVRSAPGTLHPAIEVHPETGRATLFLGRRQWARIEGLDLAASEELLDRLWAHATRPAFVHVHRWQVGDLVIWDNRRVLHRRDAFDPAARRIMHRTQVRGSAVGRG